MPTPSPRGAPELEGGGDHFAYFGTFTTGTSRGIYVARFNSTTGVFGAPTLAAEAVNPSFLAVHPNRRILYAVSERSGGADPRGAVSAFAIDARTGLLTLLNTVGSQGAGPTHLVVDRAGENVLVANYGSGSVSVLPIAADGRLAEAASSVQHHGSGVNPRRQVGPHAHFITLSHDEKFALAADLGTDQVLVYRFDRARHALVPNNPSFARVSTGAGARHLALHPNARFAYVIDEMASAITVFAFDPTAGTLAEIQMLSTLPAGFVGESSGAEIEVDRTGRFLYASNRGHNSIAVFAVDGTTGKLTLVDHVATQGKTPRHFALDPTGRFLVAENQGSDAVVVFRVDATSGRLTPTGQAPVTVGAPVCVQFVATP
ncbi:MAG: lactonase family protein [Gemmatimonadaceae bacterium]